MYKKPFLLFSLLLMVCGHTQKLTSENLADILIKGSVIDIDTRQPLEYATVSLINKKSPDHGNFFPNQNHLVLFNVKLRLPLFGIIIA